MKHMKGQGKHMKKKGRLYIKNESRFYAFLLIILGIVSGFIFKTIGENKILGVSAATIDEAKKAEKDGADYIGTGAVFPTSTKDDAPSITKKDLKNIVDSINIPVVAIGGINIENAKELKNTGISGLSVVSAIMSADNPKKASEKLLNIFNS